MTYKRSVLDGPRAMDLERPVRVFRSARIIPGARGLWAPLRWNSAVESRAVSKARLSRKAGVREAGFP